MLPKCCSFNTSSIICDECSSKMTKVICTKCVLDKFTPMEKYSKLSTISTLDNRRSGNYYSDEIITNHFRQYKLICYYCKTKIELLRNKEIIKTYYCTKCHASYEIVNNDGVIDAFIYKKPYTFI